MAFASPSSKPFDIRLLLRLSTFQIGSAMGDILVTGIWNRILIANFGIAATPVGLLIAMRYLLSPLSLWAGYRSDTRPLFGWRRTSYIWLGRALMVTALPFVGLSIGHLEANQNSLLGWGLAVISFLLYGTGTLISGSPFLALVRDSMPPERQGLAIGVVETALISFFAITGITFGRWMEVYDQTIFWEMVMATMVIGGFFWIFAIAGVERRQPAGAASRSGEAVRLASLRSTFGQIWSDPRTRRFFVFLALATMAAWTQDAILEPFGAERLGLEVGQTTRFNAYWQGATVVTLVLSAIVWRRRPPELQTSVAKAGLLTMATGMALLGGSALAGQLVLTQAGLVVFGAGFGVYTFGGLSLMVVMASDKEAGAYLGLWTIAVLVSKGLGTSLGGILRDGFLGIGLAPGLSYGAIFFLEAVGLATAVLILTSRDVIGFARDYGRAGVARDAALAMTD